MTIANRFPQTFETTFQTAGQIVEQTGQQTAERTYKRIMVLLDGSGLAERALPTAIELAAESGAEIVLICENTPGSAAYIEAKSREIRQQRIEANGYTVNASISDLPAWLLQSEKADAIVMVQKSAGWLSWLFGSAARDLARRSRAEVITVEV
jgi:nucleotide-binding universal stress UspA family protein